MASSNPVVDWLNPRYTVERNGIHTTVRAPGAVNAACQIYRDASPPFWEEIEDEVTISGGEVIKVKRTLVNGIIRVTPVG